MGGLSLTSSTVISSCKVVLNMPSETRISSVNCEGPRSLSRGRARNTSPVVRSMEKNAPELPDKMEYSSTVFSKPSGSTMEKSRGAERTIASSPRTESQLRVRGSAGQVTVCTYSVWKWVVNTFKLASVSPSSSFDTKTEF